jgi:hypothetical protein
VPRKRAHTWAQHPRRQLQGSLRKHLLLEAKRATDQLVCEGPVQAQIKSESSSHQDDSSDQIGPRPWPRGLRTLGSGSQTKVTSLTVHRSKGREGDKKEEESIVVEFTLRLLGDPIIGVEDGPVARYESWIAIRKYWKRRNGKQRME